MTRLVKAIDKFVADNKEKRAASFVVLLDENNDANQAKLAELAKKNDVATPLTISVEGAKGPGSYKLNAEVPITVLVSKKNKVHANFALAASADEEAQKKEAAAILAAAEKMLAE
ncbi:MAG: hypothetical protein FJ291_29785 [Planctomycetes bacterium]|nr:hypothetical protein [Planctomycetota bacterium]